MKFLYPKPKPDEIDDPFYMERIHEEIDYEEEIKQLERLRDEIDDKRNELREIEKNERRRNRGVNECGNYTR